MLDFENELNGVSNALRDTATFVAKVTSETGIANVVGDSAAIFSGLAIAGGIFFALISGGASLPLSAAAAALGVTAAATTLSARIVKYKHVRTSAEKVKRLLDELEPKVKIVHDLFAELDVLLERLRSLQSHAHLKIWLESTEVDWALKAWKGG